jgi:AcrR family transcriptional regulator
MSEKASKSLKDRILEAASELFTAKGFGATTAEEIAKSAGTSVSGVNRCFVNKYGVLAAVYDESWKRVNSLITERMSRCSEDPREKLLETVRLLWEQYQYKPRQAYALLLNVSGADASFLSDPNARIDSGENLQYLRRIESLCDECVEGKLVDKRYTSRSLQEAIYGISEGLLTAWYQKAWAADEYPEAVVVEEAIVPLENILFCTGQCGCRRFSSKLRSASGNSDGS